MTNTSPNQDAELRERLASIEHERWADWQRYCHEVIRQNKHDIETTLGWWDRQIALPYSELTDKEQASDMEQVDRYWPLIEECVAHRIQTAVEEFAAKVRDALPAKIADDYPVTKEFGLGWDSYQEKAMQALNQTLGWPLQHPDLCQYKGCKARRPRLQLYCLFHRHVGEQTQASGEQE